MLPRVLCLCPTYGRPSLAANALACFSAQDYQAEFRHLVMIDDAGQIMTPMQPTPWTVFSTPRFPSLPAKYNILAQVWPEYDVVCVWDDDDIYLPWHISSLVQALQDNPTAVAAKASVIWSLYQSHWPQFEPAAGRFHGSLAVRSSHLERIGGWPETRRVDFDQQMLARCQPLADSFSLGVPLEAVRLGMFPTEHRFAPGYIYRWQSTQAHHCSGDARSPDDESWYDRVPITEPGICHDFGPKFDAETVRIYQALGLSTQIRI